MLLAPLAFEAPYFRKPRWVLPSLGIRDSRVSAVATATGGNLRRGSASHGMYEATVRPRSGRQRESGMTIITRNITSGPRSYRHGAPVRLFRIRRSTTHGQRRAPDSTVSTRSRHSTDRPLRLSHLVITRP